VTSEPKQPTEEYVKSTGLKHAYAYDPDGKLSKYFGVAGIPHAVLVDPGGTVVWSGHPAALNDAIVESALAGALTEPVWTWPDETARVRELLGERSYAAALAEARKHEGPYAERVQGLVAARLARVRKAFDSGDYLGALNAAEPAAKSLAGLPEGDEVRGILTNLQSDPGIQRLIEGQRKLKAVLLKVDKVRLVADAKQLLTELEGLSEAYPDSIVGERAKAAYEALKARIP